MKKSINKFILSISLIFLFTGCDDYVDYEASENYQIVADDYFKTSSDFEAALVGVYDVLQWTLYNFMIGELASDNSLCGGESASDVLGLQQIDDMLAARAVAVRRARSLPLPRLRRGCVPSAALQAASPQVQRVLLQLRTTRLQ